jgi:hypothetical protein
MSVGSGSTSSFYEGCSARSYFFFLMCLTNITAPTIAASNATNSNWPVINSTPIEPKINSYAVIAPNALTISH